MKKLKARPPSIEKYLARLKSGKRIRSFMDLPSMRTELVSALIDAQEQVLRGKGEERHGRGRPFEDQPTFKILDLVGEGYAAGQAIKKIEEAKGLIEKGDGLLDNDMAERELLGAIGYLAMLVAWRRSRA